MIKRRILMQANDMSVCCSIKEHMEKGCIDSPSEALDSFIK